MKYKTYLALILIIVLFSFTACSSGDDPIPPESYEGETEAWEDDDEIGAGIDEGFTMDYYSDNGMYVIHSDGTAVPATYNDFYETIYQTNQESNRSIYRYSGTPMEVSKSKDTLACIDSMGDGVSEKLRIIESFVGYAEVYNEGTWYNSVKRLPDDTLEINGIDVSSCSTNDQMNSLLKSEGITILGNTIYTDEPMSVDVKYHEGTQVEHLYVDTYTATYDSPEYENYEYPEITVQMELTDDGYSVVDLSSLPNGFYCYDISQDLYTKCILHIVD